MSKTSVTDNLPPAFGQPPRSNGHTPPATRKRPDSLLMTGARALASLRFTVVLFALSIFLVFFGTVAQIDEGVWTVVSKYFRSAFVWVPFQIFFPRTLSAWVWGGFPFPGGWLLGSLLLVNLLAAHALRFKFTPRRAGVIILHLGIIVMMLGELVTGLYAVEGTMTIETGTAVNFVEERGTNELAVIRHLDAKTDDVVVVPGKKLHAANGKDQWIQNDALPFDVQVLTYMVNSTEPDAVPGGFQNPATAGDGKKLRVIEKREGTGVDAEQRIDMASAYVKLKEKGTGADLGTYLVSVWFSALSDQPQSVTVDGKEYAIYLRFKRTYKPYAVTLDKFEHKVYEGTKTPKDFASTVRVVNTAKSSELETRISMNNPLRYEGETFYQSGFLPRDQGTILQVVRNPAWTMPYVSCLMVFFGMLLHFGMKLWEFLGNKVSLKVTDFSLMSLVVPAGVTGFALIYVLMCLMPPLDPAGGMRLHDFGKLPVVSGGRSKPLQSDAMNDLLIASNHRTFKAPDGQTHDAIRWYLDVMTSRVDRNSKADEYEVFRIDNDQVLNLLGLPNKPEFLRYSVREIAPKIGVLEKEASRAEQVERDKQTLFDIKVLELAKRLQVYVNLAQFEAPNLVPPVGDKGSRTLSQAIQDMKESGEEDPDTMSLITMLSAYAANKPDEFNKELDAYHGRLQKTMPEKVHMAEFEVFFNDFEPFFQCMILYVVVAILGCLSWVFFKTPLGRSAFCLCLLTVAVHTWAIGARMYIQDRPPITNLYTTAIYIGWACVLMGLVLEVIFRNGFGIVIAGVTGFLSGFIAHNLSTDGDTLEMMQAVLDTNFWLATHVVVINTGYAATFVAGFCGILFILAALFQYVSGGMLNREVFPALSRALYGILCFATLCSFVGTVLGGIWADQSWGRFWGWDPKENGALMIVIMNALVLHARWGGLVQQRGIAVLTLFGNMITAWSWFGVNLLGVGLHAYAGQQGTMYWLILFAATQVALIVLGLMPFLDYWRTSGARKLNLPPRDSVAFKKRR